MERKIKGIWIPIEIWEDANLSWSEKILFLEIDSFTSQDQDCYVSNDYIAKMLKVTETSAQKVLSSLIKKGYVVKTKFDGRRRYVKTAMSYGKAGLPLSATQGCPKQQGRVAVDGNILNKDNNIDYRVKSVTLPLAAQPLTPPRQTCMRVQTEGPEPIVCSTVRTTPQDCAESPQRKTLFRNSELGKSAGDGTDYSAFEAHFCGPAYDGIDLVYYYHAVDDWSESSNTRRTNRGWVATVNNFIRGDREKGKLHMKPGAGQIAPGLSIRDAMDMFNPDSEY